MSVRDSHEYQRGTNVQRQTATWLALQGWIVARVNDDCAMAPMAQVWSSQVVLPDLLCVRDGRTKWADVKLKKLAPDFHVRQCRTTGIDASAHANYLLVEALTQHPVFLIFVHQLENEVRIARVGRGSFRGPGVGSSMMFWDYDTLPVLGTFADIDNTRPDPSMLTPLADILGGPDDLQPRLPGLEQAA